MDNSIIQKKSQPLAIQKSSREDGDMDEENWRVMKLEPLIDVRNLWGVIKRRLVWIFLIPVLAVGLALVYLLFFATHYFESQALIYVDPKFDRILQVEDVTSITSDLDSLNSLEQAIISDSMILRVIDKLGLRNDPSFLPKALLKHAKTEVPLNGVRLLKHIRKRYSSNLRRPTRLIEFVAYDTDAKRAQLLANTFVSEFEIFLAEQKRGEANLAKSGLLVQAEEAYTRALGAQTELNEFREKHPGVIVEQDHDLVAVSLSEAGEELNRTVARVIELRSKTEAIENFDPELEPGKIIAVGQFSSLDHVSDLMNQRASARADFAVISDQYTSRHTRYRESENRVREVDQQLAQLAGDFKSSLKAEYDGAVKNEAELRARVALLAKKLNEVKSVSSEFRAVKQKVETEWSIHEQFQNQIGETTLTAEKSTSVTTLWSEPLVGYRTTRPKKTIAVLIAGILGLLGSAGLVMADLLRDGPFANRSQLEDTLNSPVIAEISNRDLAANSQQMKRAMAQIILTNQYDGCQVFHIINSGCSERSANQIAAGIADVSAYYRAETILIRTYDSGPQGIYHLVPNETETEGLCRLDIPSSLLLTDNAWHLLTTQCQNFKRVIIDSSGMPADSQLPVYFGRFAQQNIFVVDKKRDSRERVSKAAGNFQSLCKQPVSVVFVG